MKATQSNSKPGNMPPPAACTVGSTRSLEAADNWTLSSCLYLPGIVRDDTRGRKRFNYPRDLHWVLEPASSVCGTAAVLKGAGAERPPCNTSEVIPGTNFIFAQVGVPLLLASQGSTIPLGSTPLLASPYRPPRPVATTITAQQPVSLQVFDFLAGFSLKRSSKLHSICVLGFGREFSDEGTCGAVASSKGATRTSSYGRDIMSSRVCFATPSGNDGDLCVSMHGIGKFPQTS